MRLYLKFVLPLILALGLIAYSLVPLVDVLTLKWFSRDLDMRASLIGNTVRDNLATLMSERSNNKIAKFFNQMIKDDRLYAVGLCDNSNHLIVKTQTFPEQLSCSDAPRSQMSEKMTVNYPQGLVHISFQPLIANDTLIGRLVLVHDMSFVQRRSSDTKRYVFYLFILLGVVVSTVTVLIAQLSWRGWMSGIRSIIHGEGLLRPSSHIVVPELRPIAKDLRALVRDIEADRRIRDDRNITWTPRTLKELLHNELLGQEILIVSNREPYIHVWDEGKIEVQIPASGLVTALEPVMRACSGTWIAHGSGAADRAVVDKNDHVKVPPSNPSYQIRRVWLSKEEEKGYYYGFANEGLWPLCHFAHSRPIFRAEDWNYYVQVNKKFAETVIEEANTEDPVVLVQDYHLALVPKMIKKELPNATIITFWHIPWPNPEAFGICPWRNEILQGLLGSSILGFHTRFHCNNFIDTVDRFIESRIDRETSTISRSGKLTAVNNYPISIECPPQWVKEQKSVRECRDRVRTINQLPVDIKIGVGVDRLDYTKGILERFYAIERFLELYPEYIGKFTFIQIAAPSRSSIEQYQKFESEVRSLARKINARFSTPGYEPICLKVEHHDPTLVYQYFRASDFCFVCSLHDGMNLVAKEYIASRDDDRGILILSEFTGASRELPQALIVNPYNIDQCASAIRTAIEMPETEQRSRMRAMRGLVQEFNIYRWAGRMLIDAARIRQQNRFVDKFGSSSTANLEI